MYKAQLFLFLISSLNAIQLCRSKPALFEGYRKKQQKTREARLKKSAAETRLNDISKKFRHRLQSKRNSTNYQITSFHTTRSQWIKKDIEHTQVEAKIRQRKLAAKVFKSYPEMNDIFHHQANKLQKESKEIQRQKSQIKNEGSDDFSDFKTYRKNFNEDRRAFDKFHRKSNKCIDKVDKYNEYLVVNDKNPCSIL